MPHLTLEYSNNVQAVCTVDMAKVLGGLHHILAHVGGIRIGNCKGRALGRKVYLVGEGAADGAFVHLDVAFLEGRSDDLRREIGRRMLSYLREAFTEAVAALDLQITVELRDIARAGYQKHPAGTFTP